MAAFSVSKVAGNCDVDKYYCTICEQQSSQVDAAFYCKTCFKYFCGTCIQSHVQHGWLFWKGSNNEVGCFGKDQIMKWPLSKTMENYLKTCSLHKDETLVMYCLDHSQLCCSSCVELNHSQCRRVTRISELRDTELKDLQTLLAELKTVLVEIKQVQISQKASVQSLQITYKDHEESTIQRMRQIISTTIDECGNGSVSKSEANDQNIKQEISMSIISFLDDFDNSNIKELKQMKDAVLSIKGSITSFIHKCAILQNELTQFYSTIQKIGDNKELYLIATIKCENKIQQALTVLGKADHVFTVQGMSVHNVKIQRDLHTCHITGCCVLSEEQVLIVDNSNNKVKLLNEQYQVVSHCCVTAKPLDVCQITPSEVAVTVDDGSTTHEIQFITVINSQLVIGRKFQLKHECTGIAHHDGDLFVTSGRELYKYSLSGKEGCMLYYDHVQCYIGNYGKAPYIYTLFQDSLGPSTVWRCAVSRTGDKLYIINKLENKLITLARDGKILAIYTEPNLTVPVCVHVTPAGQGLVCGHLSGTIIQVGCEGRKRLATLAKVRGGQGKPESVCYNSTTNSIIVGQCEENNILVFRVK